MMSIRGRPPRKKRRYTLTVINLNGNSASYPNLTFQEVKRRIDGLLTKLTTDTIRSITIKKCLSAGKYGRYHEAK